MHIKSWFSSHDLDASHEREVHDSLKDQLLLTAPLAGTLAHLGSLLSVENDLLKMKTELCHSLLKTLLGSSQGYQRLHFHALEKEMATHSSVLAWRIPGTEEPGGLPSMGSHRVGHD